jgi:iron complex outermembrane receptor protein
MSAQLTSVLLTASAILTTAPLRGETPADSTRLYESREEIVVTGLRTAVTRDVLPLAVTSLPSDLLRSTAGPNVLPAVAARVPGVFLTERGVLGFGVARGSAGVLSIRGLTSSRVAILLDGRPYAMGLFGHPIGDFHIAPEADRVEVVRGPASILYGSGAMGGVVNLLSPGVSREGIGGMADITCGSWNTAHVALTASYGGEDLHARAGIVRDRTDGHREGMGFGSTTGSAGLDLRMGGGLDLRANGSFQRSQSFDPGPVTLPRPYPKNRMDLDRGTIAVRLANAWLDTQGAAEASFSWGDHDLEYNAFHSDDYTLLASLYQSASPVRNGILTGGVEYREYGGSASEGPAALGEHTMSSTGIYALAQQLLLPGLSATGGFRAEVSSVFGSEIIPHAGLTAGVTDAVRVRASVSKGYRNPTINELYFQYLGKRPNPDLEPERLWSYEIGLSVDLPDNRAGVELTVFQADGANLIENRPIIPPPVTPGPTARPVNAGSLKNRGIEVEGHACPFDGMDLSITGSYVDGRPALLAVPRLQVGGEAAYRTGIVSGRVFVLHAAHLLTQTLPQERPQTYTLVNLRAGVDVAAGVEVHASLHNLLDEQYEINAGYPMPGRYVIAGVRATVR